MPKTSPLSVQQNLLVSFICCFVYSVTTGVGIFDALNKLSKRLVAISNAVTSLDKQNRDRLQGTTTLHEKLGRGLLFVRKKCVFHIFILVAFIFS